MDPTEVALVRAIAALPDEDTPRLAFADYLDEQGGDANCARAEFIRIQVELTGLPPEDPARAGLERRAAELWCGHRRQWRAAVPDVAGVNWRGFDRGFYTVIDVDQMELFVRLAGELFAAAPVQSVRVLAAHPNVTGELAALPELIRLRELDLTACRGERRRLNGQGYSRPTYRPGAAGFGYAWSYSGVLTDGDAAALAASPGVANLRVLRLGDNRIGDAGARALAASPHLGNLRRLEINTPVGAVAVGAAALAELRRALPEAEVT